jgi:hypothetical protein
MLLCALADQTLKHKYYHQQIQNFLVSATTGTIKQSQQADTPFVDDASGASAVALRGMCAADSAITVAL